LLAAAPPATAAPALGTPPPIPAAPPLAAPLAAAPYLGPVFELAAEGPPERAAAPVPEARG